MIVAVERLREWVIGHDECVAPDLVASRFFRDRVGIHPVRVLAVGYGLVGFVEVHAAAAAIVKAFLFALRTRTDTGRLAGFSTEIKAENPQTKE